MKQKTIYTQERREALRKALGNVCKHCKATGKLHFDCVYPQGHAHHQMGSRDRIIFYEREHKRGNIQLLCARCHSLKNEQDAAMRFAVNWKLRCVHCGHTAPAKDFLMLSRPPEVEKDFDVGELREVGITAALRRQLRGENV